MIDFLDKIINQEWKGLAQIRCQSFADRRKVDKDYSIHNFFSDESAL
jgi:hypothetical protein